MTIRRRDWLAASIGLAMSGTRAHDTPPAPRSAVVRALLQQGEAVLAGGDGEAAQRSFEQAAELEHAMDIELGIVRSRMQQGHYRHALAFAAHMAGAHPEDPDGTLLYAWLLAVGGQRGAAQRVLDEAVGRRPGHALVDEARRRLSEPMPVPGPALLRPPVRVAPYGSALPAATSVVASGALVGDGRHAMVPADALRSRGRLWLRNGRGQTSAGEVVQTLAAHDVAVVRLAEPWPDARPLRYTAGHDPFPGSPAAIVEFSAPAHEPAWPWLCQGFIGMPEASGARRLGIEMPPGRRGGAVFDAGGRWIGLAGRAASGADRLLLKSELEAAWPSLSDPLKAADPVPAKQRMAVDAIYEQALPSVVQVVVSA